MSELSPAAKTVLDAYDNSPFGEDCGDRVAIAAALRAVVDQMLPENAEPVGDEHDAARADQWLRIRLKMLAIAAELEAQ